MNNVDHRNETARRNIQLAVIRINEAIGWLTDAAQGAPGIASSLHQATYDLGKVISRVRDDASRIGG